MAHDLKVARKPWKVSSRPIRLSSARLEQLESQQAQILAMEEERKKAAQTDAWLGLASWGLGIASGSNTPSYRSPPKTKYVKCRKIGDFNGPVYTFKNICGAGYAPAL